MLVPYCFCLTLPAFFLMTTFSSRSLPGPVLYSAPVRSLLMLLTSFTLASVLGVELKDGLSQPAVPHEGVGV